MFGALNTQQLHALRFLILKTTQLEFKFFSMALPFLGSRLWVPATDVETLYCSFNIVAKCFRCFVWSAGNKVHTFSEIISQCATD